jgi:hypothetical protein
MLLVRVGSRYVHLLKMFGALFTFASAFFVLNSAYELNQTLEEASMAYAGGPLGDVFGSLTGPIASLFLWLGFMVLGLALYRSDRTILPLEEDIEDYPTSAPSYPQVPTKQSAKKKAKPKKAKK